MSNDTAWLIAVLDIRSLRIVEVFFASARAAYLTVRRGQFFLDITHTHGANYHEARKALQRKVADPYYAWTLPLLAARDRPT